MKMMKFTFGLLAALMLASASASAQTLLYTNAGGPVLGTGSAGYTIGFKFTVGATPITVAELGIWDYQQNPLLGSHQVGLWSSTGTLLAEATVGAGISNTLVADGATGNGFRFALTLDDGSGNPITSLTLTAGATYTLGDLQGSSDTYVTNTSSTATFDDATVSSPAAYYNPGFGDPTTSAGGTSDGYFGPNIEFAAVPEPKAALLMGLSGLLLLVGRRWKKQTA